MKEVYIQDQKKDFLSKNSSYPFLNLYGMEKGGLLFSILQELDPSLTACGIDISNPKTAHEIAHGSYAFFERLQELPQILRRQYHTPQECTQAIELEMEKILGQPLPAEFSDTLPLLVNKLFYNLRTKVEPKPNVGENNHQTKNLFVEKISQLFESLAQTLQTQPVTTDGFLIKRFTQEKLIYDNNNLRYKSLTNRLIGDIKEETWGTHAAAVFLLIGFGTVSVVTSSQMAMGEVSPVGVGMFALFSALEYYITSKAITPRLNKMSAARVDVSDKITAGIMIGLGISAYAYDMISTYLGLTNFNIGNWHASVTHPAIRLIITAAASFVPEFALAHVVNSVQKKTNERGNKSSSSLIHNDNNSGDTV